MPHDWRAHRGFVRLALAASREPRFTTMSATGRVRARRSDYTAVDQTEAGYGDLKGFTSDDGLGVRGSVLGETSAATNSYLAAGIASEARTSQSRFVTTIHASHPRRGRQA